MIQAAPLLFKSCGAEYCVIAGVEQENRNA